MTDLERIGQRLVTGFPGTALTPELVQVVKVALRKESVDRNECDWKLVDGVPCRSPQGERGMFLFLTVQGGFVHADIRFNFKNCYSKKLSHKII